MSSDFSCLKMPLKKNLSVYCLNLFLLLRKLKFATVTDEVLLYSLTLGDLVTVFCDLCKLSKRPLKTQVSL